MTAEHAERLLTGMVDGLIVLAACIAFMCLLVGISHLIAAMMRQYRLRRMTDYYGEEYVAALKAVTLEQQLAKIKRLKKTGER